MSDKPDDQTFSYDVSESLIVCWKWFLRQFVSTTNSCICTSKPQLSLNGTNGSSFLLPTLVYALPITQMLLSWTYFLQYWCEAASKLSSLEPFSFNARLEMRSKFNAVSSQPDLTWMYVLNFPSLFLSWTNEARGSLFPLPTPVYALPTSNCSSIEPMVACLYYHSCICTSVFLSWIFFV